MFVEAVVELIFGLAHHVAVLSATPPNSADTICHGGTCKADGLEISFTPVESVTFVGVRLWDCVPSPLTRACTSAGPPFLTICRFAGSVTTLAFPSAFRTLRTSAFVSLSAKKC